MVEDAGVPVLLTQSHLKEQFAPFAPQDLSLICVDVGWNAGLRGNEENLTTSVQPHNLVYMIYTSGSTGQPKGVMNIHQAVCNRLIWMQQAYHLTSEDRVLQKTPFSFDVSVWEFFWPLLTGAGLVVARPGGHQDPSYLATVIAESHITTLHFVPSMLQAFLLEPHLEKYCSSLKQVVTSGEALSYELQERFFARFPDPQVALHNLYGPTEAAIDVTFWECQRGSKPQSIPIGRPIANTQIYILDAALQPTPIGVPGELYIGGVGLARGYHKRPALTAEKFLRDPFSMADGARLFKTADLARYRADGAIEFLGRMDHQVKIRGFRIELGEIEAVLSQHPGVQEVVVLAREDVPGDKRLVAYVVAGEAAGTEQEWRSYLRERLPEYMVPSVFLPLEALPLTPNGKVDRRGLPAPEQRTSGGEYVPPQTLLEEQLAQIWAEVLGLERVGLQENFFDIGGHSLLAVQVLARIREEMQKILSLGSFFKAQTVEEMARLIGGDEDLKSPYLVPIKRTGTRPPLFCFHPVGGEILMYRTLAASLDKDQPMYGLQSQAVEGTMPELESIEAMAREYTAAIRKQQPDGPYYLLGWSTGGVIAVAVASELEHTGQKVIFVGLLDAYLTSPEDILTQQIDPFDGLGLIIEAAMTRTRYILSEEEQETLRENLLALPQEKRLPQALILAKERKLLPESLSLEVFKLQEGLANTHRSLLRFR